MPKPRKIPTETNPFRNEFVIDAYFKMEKTVGEYINITLTPQEKESYTSIYSAAFMPMYKQLNSASKDLLMYIVCKLPYNKDYLEINVDDYCSYMDLTSRTFSKARLGLLNLVIIPRKSRANTYWINPRFIFRGKRTKFFSDCVRVDKAREIEASIDSQIQTMAHDKLDKQKEDYNMFNEPVPTYGA